MTKPRRAPMTLPPIVAGECDWCGGNIPKTASNYCGPTCRRDYNNLLTKQGRTIAQAAKLWRNNTPADCALQMLTARLDEFLTEDIERKARFEKGKTKWESHTDTNTTF